MGQTLSEPVVDKVSDSASSDKMAYGSSCMQGWRISMEDAHTTFLKCPGDEKAAIFAVFDGHGGRLMCACFLFDSPCKMIFSSYMR